VLLPFMPRWGSPTINTSINVIIPNITLFNAGLSKTDPDLLITGMTSLTIGSEQTFEIEATVTRLVPSVQVTLSGGQNLNTDNTIPNLIFAIP